MYMVNCFRPMTEPRGALLINTSASDLTMCVWMICVRPDRYELNHSYAHSVTPKQVKATRKHTQLYVIIHLIKRSAQVEEQLRKIETISGRNYNVICTIKTRWSESTSRPIYVLVCTVKRLIATLSPDFEISVRFQIGPIAVR